MTFDTYFQTDGVNWKAVTDFEGMRHALREVFFTVRAAVDETQKVMEVLQNRTGIKVEGMDRLRAVIEDARRLEEAVFGHWPSFRESLALGNNTSTVDESLAEILGITIDEARQRMDARRRELNAKAE